MSLETVAHDAVAIYLDGADLVRLGIFGPLSGKTARALVCRALKARGEKPWDEMEVDLFTSEGSLLLLARPPRMVHHCFSFDNFELLLSAVQACAVDLPSRLAHYEGSFILCISASQEGIPPQMFEFGEKMPYSTELSIHMTEHGSEILASDAMARLREMFGG